MNRDDNPMPAKYRGNRMTSGVIIAAAVVLIAALLLLFLMKLGVIGVPAFLDTVFGDFGKNENTEVAMNPNDIILPEFAAGSVHAEDHYYRFSVDPRETLAALTEWESYVREFRVINSYNEETDSRRYVLTVDGDRFRLESDSKTILCDGTAIYTITATYRTPLNGTVFTLENEIGITPLSEIKAIAENGSVTYPTGDDKHLLIVSEDAELGILSEYLVSVETGIVMSERSYIGGTLYRAVVTDSVDVFAAEDLPEEYFAISAKQAKP